MSVFKIMAKTEMKYSNTVAATTYTASSNMNMNIPVIFTRSRQCVYVRMNTDYFCVCAVFVAESVFSVAQKLNFCTVCVVV